MKRLCLLFPFFVFAASGAVAQACFTVNDSIACVPAQIIFTSCTGQDIAYFTDFARDDSLPKNFRSPDTITYDQPGTFILAQVTENDTAQKTIRVFAKPQPLVAVVPCNNLAVSLAVNDTTYDSLHVDFGDGFSQTYSTSSNNPIVHSYNDQGPFNINVQGLYAEVACGGSRTLQAQPQQSLQRPDLGQLAQADDDWQLTFSATQGLEYALQGNNRGNWQNIRTFTATGGNQTLGFRASQSCFRLRHETACGDEILSDTLCKSIFSKLTPNEDQFALEWEASQAPDFERYVLLRDGQEIASFDQQNRTTFTDKEGITCGTEFCYQLRTESTAGVARSLSQCKVAALAPLNQAVREPLLTYNNESFTLTWSTAGFGPDIRYRILARGEENRFFRLAETAEASFEIGAEAPTCYRVQAFDNCDQTSPASKTVCPFRVEADQSQVGNINLVWENPPQWAEGTDRFVVEVRNQDGELVREEVVTGGRQWSDQTFDTANQVLFYQVIAHPNSSNREPVFSKPVRVVQPSEPVIPTAFSPNNDGINERYRILTPFAEEVEMLVFDQWGSPVFKSEEKNPHWKGNANGTPLPEGSYIIRLEMTDQVGQHYQESSSLTLIR